MLVSSWVEFR